MRRHRALAVIAASLIMFAPQARGQQSVHRIGVLGVTENPEAKRYPANRRRAPWRDPDSTRGTQRSARPKAPTPCRRWRRCHLDVQIEA